MRRPRFDQGILFAGALYQALLRIRSFSIEYDHVFPLACAINFIRGGELALTASSAQDLSAFHSSPVTSWPPGMAVLMSLLLRIVRSPAVMAVLSDVLGIVLLYSAFSCLLKRLAPLLTARARLLIVLSLGFAGPPILAWFSNLWSIGSFFWALALLLPRDGEESPAPVRSAVAGVLLGLTVSFRFAFLPAALMPVLVMMLMDVKTPQGRRATAAALAGLLVGLAPMIWWWVHTHLPTDEVAQRRWNFQNLIRFYSFPADALFGRRLSDRFWKSHYLFKWEVDPLSYTLRTTLSLALFLGALMGGVQMIRQSSAGYARRLWTRFLAMGLTVSGGTIGLLVLLSLRLDPGAGINGWVFVEEPRYFTVCLPFLLVLIAFMATNPARGFGQKFSKAVCVLGFALSFSFWLSVFPGEIRSIRAGRPGSGVERYFAQESGLAEMMLAQRSADTRNVFLEIGRWDVGTPLRGAIGTCVGVPQAIVPADKKIVSSTDLNVIAFAGERAFPSAVAALNRFCEENAGTSVSFRKDHVCRATLKANKI